MKRVYATTSYHPKFTLQGMTQTSIYKLESQDKISASMLNKV